MGASNVKAVYAVWAAIPDPAFRLLVYIALTTRDEDCPPVFWGGQESLAIGLGRRPPFTPADWRAVDRAMAKLRTHGALKPRGGSAPGQTARHEVVLTPDAVRQVNTRREASVEHPTPGDSNTRRPASEHPTPRVGTPDAPRRTEEEQEPPGLNRGTRNPRAAQRSGRARAAQRCSRGMLIAGDGSCCPDHDFVAAEAAS